MHAGDEEAEVEVGSLADRLEHGNEMPPVRAAHRYHADHALRANHAPSSAAQSITSSAASERTVVRPMARSRSAGEMPVPGRLTAIISRVIFSPRPIGRAATRLLRATRRVSASDGIGRL